MTEAGRGEQPRIDAIDRAVVLLETLAAAGPGGLSLKELSAATGIGKATAYRALSTMRFRGFAGQGRDGSYRLGPRALLLGATYHSSDDLQVRLRPVLDELATSTQELVHLGAWDGDEVIYLDKVEPAARPIRVWSAVGQRVPAASSALGRALLAAGSHSPAELDRLAGLLPPGSPVTPSRLAEAVAAARATGFADEQEENEPGIGCLGFALLRDGVPVAAISITSLATRMDAERRAELRRLVAAEVPRLLPPGVQLHHPDGSR